MRLEAEELVVAEDATPEAETPAEEAGAEDAAPANFEKTEAKHPYQLPGAPGSRRPPRPEQRHATTRWRGLHFVYALLVVLFGLAFDCEPCQNIRPKPVTEERDIGKVARSKKSTTADVITLDASTSSQDLTSGKFSSLTIAERSPPTVRTPMERMQAGHRDVVETPIMSGARANTRDRNGLSTLGCSALEGHTDIATMHCAAEATGAPRRARYTPLRPLGAKFSMTDQKIAFVAASSEIARKAVKTLKAKYDHVAPEDADVIIALGGDGHMLETLHAWLDRDVPIPASTGAPSVF